MQPVLGRLFNEKDALISASDTIILSYEVWQSVFGGDPKILGRTLGDTRTTVIGVMPDDFNYPPFAQVWIPLARDSGEMVNRSNRYFQVIGLLKRGYSIESAQSQLQTVASRLAAQYPDTNKNITVHLTAYRDRIVSDVKTVLWILLGVVGLVLLIACANVANLMLARGVSRQREIAIRLAMGASRRNLIRQLLTESLLLSVLSGIVGLALSFFAVDWLVVLLPEKFAYLQFQDRVKVDGTVMLFTLAASFVTGLVFGLFPAWQASRTSINENLKEGGHSTESFTQLRYRSILIAAEVVLATVVLIGAGLLISSFVRLQKVSLGFDPGYLIATAINLPFMDANDETRAQFIQTMLQRVKSTPGVSAVAASTGTPFPYLHFSFTIEGRSMSIPGDALYDVISEDYFQVMKATMAAGREFNKFDTRTSNQVMIINEAFARLYFHDENPLGKRISIRFPTPETREIVGVVKDLNQGEPRKVLPQMYVHYLQRTWLSASLIVRMEKEIAGMKKAIQQMVWSIDPRQPQSKVDSPVVALAKSLAEPRLYAFLLAIFGLVALVLSAVGIYAVVAHTVANKTHEIGIHMALGAQPRDVLVKTIIQGMSPTAVGVAIGLLVSFGLTRLIRSYLFGVTATDPLTFIAISTLLCAVALLACFLPARRATKVDPLVALRYE